MPARLLELLSRGLSKPLTLISAPAGYGKTALVTEWLARLQEPWAITQLTVPAGDTSGDASEGVSGVVSGVVSGAAVAVALWQASTEARVRAASGTAPLLCVLDCADAALPPTVGEALQGILGEAPPALRLVLLTRTDPPLKLHQLRLTDSISEIRAADLRLTEDEAASMLQRAGCRLSPTDLGALHERTGGWPAGLRFASLLLAGSDDPSRTLAEFRGDSGTVSEYLVTEVLDHQPEGTRDFLLRTSLVAEMSPELAQALTGGSWDARTLRFLAGGSSLMHRVPGTSDRYRYPPLFKEFLTSQLQYEQPGLVPELHRTAGEYFARAGRPLAAARHAAAGGAWTDAARFFVEGLCFGTFLGGHEVPQWQELFAPLPDSATGPDVAVVRACLSIVAQDRDGRERHLAAARAGFASPPATPSGLSLALPVLRAVNASLGTDADQGLEAVSAAEGLVRRSPFVDDGSRHVLAGVLAECKARLLVQSGHLASARVVLEQRTTPAGGIVDAQLGRLHGAAALVEALSGHLRRAAELARPWSAVRGARADCDEGDVSSTATLAMAWVRMEEYDVEGASALLELVKPAAWFDVAIADTTRALLRARLQCAAGDVDSAVTGLDAALRSAPEGWLAQRLLLEQAATLIRSERPADAVSLVAASGTDHAAAAIVVRRALLAAGTPPGEVPAVPAVVDESDCLDVMVEARLVAGEQAIIAGDDDRGTAFLRSALQIAAPEQMRRPFVEAPPVVAAALGGGTLSVKTRWLRREAGASDPLPEHVPGAATVQPLTAKELEVLGHLADLLTTEEIAAAMFVSVNTVRSHVRSILRKLEVTRRNEAVRRGWALGLIPA